MASITITTYPASGSDSAGTVNAVVHGQPASLQDAGDGTLVSLLWVEHDQRWFVSANGISGGELVAPVNGAVTDVAAKTLRTNPATGWVPVVLPSGGYRFGDIGSGAVAGSYRAGSISQLVTVTAESARPGDSLDAFVGNETRRVMIDGIERSIRDDVASPISHAQVVVWFDHDYQVTLTTLAPLSAEKLAALIGGVELAPPAKMSQAAEQVTARDQLEGDFHPVTTWDLLW